MKLYKIESGNLKLDGGAMFGVVPKVLWNKLYPADENNLCNWAMRCLLIETNGKLILIDTGMGDKQPDKFFKHYYPNGDNSLLSSLKKNGFSPEDITDVLITHLHFDHVGGAVKKDKDGKLSPAFPNAIYHISKGQWDWAMDANRREKASFLPENYMPLQEHKVLNLVEEETELFPNVFVKMFDGHTNAQMLPFIKYKGQTIVYGADLFPSTAHIPMPYIMGYDTRPLGTLEDKKRFFKEAVPNDYILFFEHDLYNECCSLQDTEKGVKVKDTFSLQEFTNSFN
ncbi:MAG: MBL fold metallo-hydrolase [Bacteroidota bacterium]|nr:MBL fold metallo-hydrolase [Bacteroidota bacterium]